MTATISLTIDGQSITVDLSRVTAREALSYRSAVGEDIDGRLGAILAMHDQEPPLADKALLVWLWRRQNGSPGVTLAGVAATLTLLPAPAEAPVESPS